MLQSALFSRFLASNWEPWWIPCHGILQALALEANERNEDEAGREELEHITFYEITIASVDQPKLLSRLSEALVSWCGVFHVQPLGSGSSCMERTRAEPGAPCMPVLGT